MSSSAAAKKRQHQEGFKRNEEKWTPTLFDAGWTVIPNVILERQQALELDATDVNILLHLIRHWWFAENLPFPSKRTIAECMGITVDTVRRRIKKMEAAGYIKRINRSDSRHGQQSNYYDLSGLIESCKPLAEEIIQTKQLPREEDAERRKRKFTKLKVVD
jgi:hypothetical protein